MMYTDPAWKLSAPCTGGMVTIPAEHMRDALRGKLKSARNRLEGLQQEPAHNRRQHKALGAAIAGYLGLDSILVDEAAAALAAI